MMETTEVKADITGPEMNWIRKPRLKTPAKISISPAQKARVTAL